MTFDDACAPSSGAFPCYSVGRGITIITDQGSSTKQESFPCRQEPLSALTKDEFFEEKVKRKGQSLFSAHAQYEIMV